MRYFLIGLPGSGKSHWGKIWSDKIKSPYFDLDETIVNNEGLTIQELFDNEGEEYFRNLETFYLKKLIDNHNSFILSTGGGTACFNNNIKLMNEKGLSLYLNPPLEKIAERVWKPRTNKRPLFSNCGNQAQVINKLEDLHNQRNKYYQEAKFTFQSWDEFTIENIPID